MDFKSNPQRIIGPKMGSRDDNPSIYWLPGQTEQCIIGCFSGSLKDFENAVQEKHGDNKYGKQYMEFIQKCKTIISMF